MDNRSVLKLRKELVEKRYELRKEISQVEDDIKNLESECNHDIIYKTPPRPRTGHTLMAVFPPQRYCLFCGKYFDNLRDKVPTNKETGEPDSVIIDLANYPLLYKNSRFPFALWIENIYKVIFEDDPDINQKEVGELIIEELDAQERELKAIEKFENKNEE